jgi:hypothetical protein
MYCVPMYLNINTYVLHTYIYTILGIYRLKYFRLDEHETEWEELKSAAGCKKVA